MITSDRDVRGLFERVHKLETQNRRWKLVSLLLIILMGPTLLMGLKPYGQGERPENRSETVEARTFILRDGEGHVRARLTMNGREPSFDFYDASGKVVWTAPPKAKMTPTRWCPGELGPSCARGLDQIEA